MSELKKCPFCSGEADCNNTGCQDYKLNPLWWVECLGCGVSTSGSKEKEEAISTWNRRAEPVTGIPATENKPLTLEELRGMDGEPVCVLWPGGEVFWCLCHEGWMTPPSCIPFAAEDCPRCTFYSQKPKEETK